MSKQRYNYQVQRYLFLFMTQMFIDINKPFYFAGEMVQGHVYLNLLKKTNGNKVIIKFKGWQSVRWVEQHNVTEEQVKKIIQQKVWKKDICLNMESSDSEQSRNVDSQTEEFMNYKYIRRNEKIKFIQHHNGRRPITRFSSVLYNSGGNFIPAGQYSFPFSFKTAETFPASFIQRSNDRTRKGRIKYEIQAFVKGYNQIDKYIKYKTEIIVRETTIVKNQRQKKEVNVKSCCCFDQGISKIQCFFDKNAYSPGENAIIHCLLDTTKSKTNINNVDVSLINQITYKSKENHSKVLVSNIFSYTFEGLAKGLQKERIKKIPILNLTNNEKTDIKPTARGKNLNSVYFLKVEAQLDVSCTCCSELPIVNQDILIYPYIPINYTFKAPKNWIPKEMPMVNVQVSVNVSNKNLNQMVNTSY